MAVTNKQFSNRQLSVLQTAALLLPGMISIASAEIAPEDFKIDSSFSRYAESNGRMKVDIYQNVATIPVSERLSFRINGVKDVISGASPVGPALPINTGNFGFIHYTPGTTICNGPKLNGLTQCMSGASISDVRDEIDLNTSYFFGASTVDVDVGRSSENDYESNFFNINHRYEFNNKLTTVTTGYAFASDQVWEIVKLADGSKGRSSAHGGDKQSHQGILGLTQILDKNSLMQANLSYSYNGGYLSDPYKYAYASWLNTVANPCNTELQCFVHDARPGSRNQVSLLLRYIHNFTALNAAALHLDYRYYADTWGVDSHTFELAWHQPLLDSWQFRPRIRYYTQSAADFYQVYFIAPTSNGYYSSDYRLANFGAMSGGVQLSTEFVKQLNISAGVDFYQRQMAYGLASGAGTALDNYSFSIYSVNISYKFQL